MDPQSVVTTSDSPVQLDPQSSPVNGQIPLQPPPQPPALPQQSPTPAQADVAHSTALGHGLKSIMNVLGGSRTTYQQTPQGPVPVQVKNTPGDFFKLILGSAIAGAAAGGGESGGSGWVGAAKGLGGAQQFQQRNQQQAQAQAQQQFQNQITAQKEAREAQSATTEEQLRKAQIGMYNIQKLKDLQEIQGQSYTQHENLLNNAKPVVEAYKATGLTPIVENVSETEHEQYMKSHPGAASLDWQPTGITHYVDADGNTSYQTQWSAYDPKGNIVVPQSMLNEWKKSGLLAQNPNLVANLKKNADGQPTLPYSGFISLQDQNQKLVDAQKTRDANDYQKKLNDATLVHLAAEAVQERASAAASGTEGALKAFELKQEKAGADASAALVKHDGDWSKLTPDQKVALQPQVQKTIDEARQSLNDPLLKEQLSSLDPDVQKAAQAKAAQLHEQLDDAKANSIFVPPAKTPPAGAPGTGDPRVQATVSALKGKSPEDVQKALANPAIPESAKPAIWKALGLTPPKPLRWTPQQVPGFIGQAIQTGASALSGGAIPLPTPKEVP